MTAELLVKANVVAGSDREIVLTVEDLDDAQDLYQENVKKQALRLIKRIDKQIKNYYVVLDSDWDKILNVFTDQWKSGCKKPVLPKMDLKIYEYEKPKEEPKIVSKAIELFGEDKVIIKE